MSDPVFERYKEALKQGHLALLGGKPKSALERYTEAAALADHRALPHLSVGSVLLRLGRPREALSAFVLDRLLQLDDDPTARAALVATCAANRELDARLAAIAS